MNKLIFRYGTMNSGKTANLIMNAFNLKSQDKNIFVIKPIVDTRWEPELIKSRAFPEGLKVDLIMTPDMDVLEVAKNKLHCIFVDECQFLSPLNVEALRNFPDQIPIICYGLRTDYSSLLFPGSKRLMELADVIEEFDNYCNYCPNKATINAKFIKNNQNTDKIIREGNSQIELGSEELYKPLCWECWK